MKKVSIKYNPYLVSTQINISNHVIKDNSSLRFEKQRLQEWADKLPDLLVKECNDKNFQIEFKGTQTDFEDLKLAFELKRDIISSSFNHISTLDISKVEEEVDKIFETIQKGSVAELRTPAITEAFKKAKNQEFEVNVIATMSSGKSTLINALLGKQLMPARVEATTATVVKIINSKQHHYSLRAFDSEDKELKEYNLEFATPEQIDALNDNPNVSTLEIKGPIPFVSTVGMQLVLVDTPGPNNARNKNHEKLTYEMLEDSDKSLVLYILNGEQLGIVDNERLLDYVCKCMKEGGKQSRDRYLFVVNKLDVWKLKEANRIEKKLKEELENLEQRGIYNPCLFPVSSLAALELRTDEKDIQALNTFRTRAEMSDSYHFDNYYGFNRLPMVVKNRLQTILDRGNSDQIIEIHSGIVSIEQAISLYVNKYARTTKIKDLVDSFNIKLNDLAAMENIRKAIREDQIKKAEIERQISVLRRNLSAAKEAKTCTSIIDSLDLTIGLKKMVKDNLKEILSTITTIISTNKGTSVELSEAKKACEKIDKEFNTSTIQLQVKIDKIIKQSYDEAILKIINEYKKYLDQLNIKTKSQDFVFSPISLVSADLQGLTNANKLIDTYKGTPVDEGKYVTVYRKKKVEGDRVESAVAGGFWGTLLAGAAFAADCLGGCGLATALVTGAGLGIAGGAAAGSDDHEEEVPEQEWQQKMVTYVNMADLVTNYFMPRQKALTKLPNKVVAYVKDETSKLKDILSSKLDEIDDLVEAKLKELSDSQIANEQTAEDIRKNEEKLMWLEGIQEQINKLILF
ncbi:MAG: dynamin family protein [Prevotella sp.]|nr:dynamin family protein [Prevotella sp.]